MNVRLSTALLLSLSATAWACGGGPPPASPAGEHHHEGGPHAHHPADAPRGDRARSVEVPGQAGAGAPREARAVVEVPGLKVATIVLRQGTALPTHHAESPVTIQALVGAGFVVAGDAKLRVDRTHIVVLAPKEPHSVEPDPGTDLVLLVHHAGGGEHHHP